MFDLLSRFLVFWARSSLQLYVCSSFYAFCVNLSQYSSNAAILKIAIIFSVFGCWELLAFFFFKGWIMFTFMSSRCATKYTDRSEAAHCRIEGCCCCSFRQVPCSCHQKKKIHLSLFWVRYPLWSILAIGNNRIPDWKRKGFSLLCQ